MRQVAIIAVKRTVYVSEARIVLTDAVHHHVLPCAGFADNIRFIGRMATVQINHGRDGNGDGAGSDRCPRGGSLVGFFHDLKVDGQRKRVALGGRVISWWEGANLLWAVPHPVQRIEPSNVRAPAASCFVFQVLLSRSLGQIYHYSRIERVTEATLTGLGNWSIPTHHRTLFICQLRYGELTILRPLGHSDTVAMFLVHGKWDEARIEHDDGPGRSPDEPNIATGSGEALPATRGDAAVPGAPADWMDAVIAEQERFGGLTISPARAGR